MLRGSPNTKRPTPHQTNTLPIYNYSNLEIKKQFRIIYFAKYKRLPLLIQTNKWKTNQNFRPNFRHYLQKQTGSQIFFLLSEPICGFTCLFAKRRIKNRTSTKTTCFNNSMVYFSISKLSNNC